LELFGLSGAMPAHFLGDGFTGIFPSIPAMDTWMWSIDLRYNYFCPEKVHDLVFDLKFASTKQRYLNQG
jgi:hypothetical protein